jgi:hypothetical protein
MLCLSDPELVKGSFSIIVALIVLGGVYLTAMRSLKMNRETILAKAQETAKTLFIQTVTQERAKWRQDLRVAMGDLGEAVQMILDNGPKSLAEFQRHRIAVRLRVNPLGGPENALDQAIMESLGPWQFWSSSQNLGKTAKRSRLAWPR